MWIYSRVLKISWCNHITNINVLKRMNKELEIEETIKSRKLQYLGHVMRHPEKYNLLNLIILGKIVGKKSQRRPQISWLDNLNGSILLGYLYSKQPLIKIKLLT